MNTKSPLINVGVILMTLALSFVTAFTDVGFLLRTSIVGIPEHAPYDGVTNPVKKVPNWVKVSAEKGKGLYKELAENELVDLPYYDPVQLYTSVDTLKWGDANDDKIRIAKITYPVPYMGNYLLDGRENAGSHPAVDIKLPIGTPIYAIGNGTVVKTSEINSGFGYHIVIQHNNFPSYSSASKKETIYSSYSHLSGVLVKQGQVVTKGQQIGLSGETGTATTPHLHFQIDNDSAPWHPFWPFSSSEMYEAGLNFFSAINEGLGKEKAIETTINPMKYIQKYLNASSGSNTTKTESSTSTTKEATNVASSYINNISTEKTVTQEVDEVSSVESPVVIEETNDSVVDEEVEKELNFKFNVKPSYFADSPEKTEFSIELVDQFGNAFGEGFSGEMVITSADGNVRINKPIVNIRSFDYRTGVIENSFRELTPGTDRIKIEYNGNELYSERFEIVQGKKNVSFSDISSDSKYFSAVSYLYDKNVVTGYSDGTFKPDKQVSRVEALKFILEGIKVSVKKGKLPFNDVSEKEWYGKYLYTAVKKKIVDGYPDGSFRPADTVNKAEFFKILFNGMGVEVSDNIKLAPFDDVPADSWFAPYFSKAKSIKILDKVDFIYPSQPMTRGEVADAMYKLMLYLEK